MRCDFLSKLVCCLSLLLFNSSFAKELNSHQYDARLCSAQLLVIKGDLKRLQLSETKQHHKTGLKQRINGALGTLGWLCRQHEQAIEVGDQKLQKRIKQFRSSFESKDWQASSDNIEFLISSKPLDVNDFNFQNLSNSKLKTSISIYQHYCKSCHYKPSDQSETPAYSFFDMSKKMSQQELLARMLVGVHGTPKIALRNPLTDDDIAGLITYFTKNKDN